MGLTKRRADREAARAGDLLPVSALREDGLLLRDDGAVVRYLEVLPRNPLVMDDHDLDRLAHGFEQLLARLPAGYGLQAYVEAQPVALDELLGEYADAVAHHTATLPDSRTAEALRAPGELHEESLHHQAADHAAVRVRHVLVVPLHPAAAQPWERLIGRRAPATSRDQLARRSLALVDALRAELEASDLGARLLDGPAVADLLARRFAPAHAGFEGTGPPLLAAAQDIDATADRTAAMRLKAALCCADIDASDRRLLRVDSHLEQTVHLSSAPEATFTGWLLHAMQSAKPWTLSVHVRALDRALERRHYKQRHRRLYGVNRGAEAAGRVPDYDQRDHEAEIASVVAELTHAATGGLYEVSVYQSLREPGPDPDPLALADAVDQAVGAIQHTADVRVSRGELRQLELWRSTLPLGLDVAKATKRLATLNAADMLPLVGTSCGSPAGLHLGYAEPGRTLERLDPFDPLHDNGTLIVNAKSGGGKTMLVQALLAQAMPLGAQAAVIDRSAGHYRFLCDLIPGARHVRVGGEEGVTVNPWDVEDPANVAGAKISFLVRLHTLLIGDHHADADAFGLSPLERNLLELAVRGVYAQAAQVASGPASRRCATSCASAPPRRLTRSRARPRWPPPTARSPSACTPSAPTAPTAPCSTARPRSTSPTRRWSSSTPRPSLRRSPRPSCSACLSSSPTTSSAAARPSCNHAGRTRGRSTGASSSCSRSCGSSSSAAPPAPGSTSRPAAPATSACSSSASRSSAQT